MALSPEPNLFLIDQSGLVQFDEENDGRRRRWHDTDWLVTSVFTRVLSWYPNHHIFAICYGMMQRVHMFVNAHSSMSLRHYSVSEDTCRLFLCVTVAIVFIYSWYIYYNKEKRVESRV